MNNDAKQQSTGSQEGSHPLVDLFNRVATGEIDLKLARLLAVKTEILDSLDPASVNYISNWVSALVKQRQIHEALLVADLFLTASEALPNKPENIDSLISSEMAWLHSVTWLLPYQPDWHQYQSARNLAARMLRRSRQMKNKKLAGITRQYLAELHFQPLVASYTSEASWQDTLHIWYETGASKPHQYPFPPPAQALSYARKCYHHAAMAVTDNERGQLLKGEVAAIYQYCRLTNTAIPEEVNELTEQAMQLLDPQIEMVGITYLLGVRQEMGISPDSQIIITLLEQPIEQQLQVISSQDLITAHINLSKLMDGISPKLGIVLLERVAPVVQNETDENTLTRYYNSMLNSLRLELFPGKIDHKIAVMVNAQQIQKQAEAESWTSPEVAGALLLLAIESPQTTEELDGLKVLDDAKSIFPDPFDAYPAMFHYLKMSLWAGEGVNSVKKNEYRKAVLSYGNAIRLGLDLGYREFVKLHLKYLVNTVQRGDDAVILDSVGIIFDIGLKLEVHLGNDGIELLQTLTRHLTSLQLADGSANANILHLTWQIAKSRRFSAAIRTKVASAISDNDYSSLLLEKITNLRSKVGLLEEGLGPGSRIDYSRRLLAFVRHEIPASGETALEQLNNLQFHYDQWLEHEIAQKSDQREAEIFALNEIQEKLDSRTVLLQLYIGEYNGNRAMCSLLVSKNTNSLAICPDSVGLITRFSEADRHEEAYSYEEDVYLTRQAILNESMDETLLAKYFHAAGGAFLHGTISQALEKLKQQGCDHLIIAPHGPYHFAPLQLFSEDERLLADDWIVSVIPNIEMMRRSDENKKTNLNVTACGVSFIKNNPYELQQLPDATDEAIRISNAFKENGKVILDDDVTEENITKALSNSKYLHVATHGALNLDAPAFQYLVVTPSNGNDGVLHAHELLRQDLSGIRLISLSACETALGRIDRADNPRGLPASLLLAGVDSIVGTLWEVKSDTARAFFVELYRELSKRSSRRDAFRKAQLQIRKRFPHPSDWGAFYLLGAWD